MTELDNANQNIRERDARDARFFAWDVPGDANIVALVHESDDAERSATVVDAIATSVARRREHTLLLSAEPGPTPLDELLGGEESEGLPAALGGRARLTDVAVQRVDRPFVYLPAGHDPEALAALLADDVLASFVARVRERGGTLFLVVSERTRLSPRIGELVDGYVKLGDATLPPGAEGLEAFGRVLFDDSEPAVETTTNGGSSEPTVVAVGTPAEVEEDLVEEDLTVDTTEPEAAEGPADAPEPEAETVPVDESEPVLKGFPLAPVAGGLGVVAALVLGWWWLAGITASGAPIDPGPATAALAEAPAPETPPPLDPIDVARVFETAPEAPFSVLIASFAAKADADERIDLLRSNANAGLFFSAPTPVRGVIYHRVFAGALPSEVGAQSLMDRLVDSGDKDEASSWHMRPVRLAFDLGVFVDRAVAGARISSLSARGVPSYVLAASLDGEPVFRVYAGSYENERSSIPMAELLDGAGEPATLIARHGEAETPSTP